MQHPIELSPHPCKLGTVVSHLTRESAKALVVLPLNAAENAGKLGHTATAGDMKQDGRSGKQRGSSLRN